MEGKVVEALNAIFGLDNGKLSVTSREDAKFYIESFQVISDLCGLWPIYSWSIVTAGNKEQFDESQSFREEV